ncbi:hypothetical protein OUZ56_031662 [Daphnia magna]|uniref:Uncharacterized protein n=1 Tax=Daphnia magna TaxID=35525 RepID=A0ABQ9ZUV7_9CRUS|nr:hypothetical protein OUZ56_031662 [Daphnia magna]
MKDFGKKKGARITHYLLPASRDDDFALAPANVLTDEFLRFSQQKIIARSLTTWFNKGTP